MVAVLLGREREVVAQARPALPPEEQRKWVFVVGGVDWEASSIMLPIPLGRRVSDMNKARGG